MLSNAGGMNLCFLSVFVLTVYLLVENASGEDADYLGCYDVTEQVFQLKNHSVELTSTNSPGSCKVVCYDLGYPYAAVQNGKDCHCGVALNAAHVKTFDKMCQQQPCTGDSALSCGAADAQAVYKTGRRVFKWSEYRLDNHPADILMFSIATIPEDGVKRVWVLFKNAPDSSQTDYRISNGGQFGGGNSGTGNAAITTGRAGMFMLRQDGNVFKRIGITATTPSGNGSEMLPGGLVAFDCGLNQLYGIAADSRSVMGTLDTGGWQELYVHDADVDSISAGKDTLWFLDNANINYLILSSTNGVGQFANDGKVDISASDGDTVAAMDAQGKIYLREGVGLSSMAGTHWAPIPFARTVVKVVADMFDIWVLDDLNRLWKGEIQITDAEYLGCFVDSVPDCDLSAKSMNDGPGMTVDKCKDFCYGQGYLYAGVQSGSECYCDNAYGKHGEIHGSECGFTCSGHFNERCGGSSRNSVYKTGFVTTPDQQVSLGEQSELTCDYPARYAPAHVAWIKDGVVLQNKTVDTALLVSPSELSTVNYQCVINKHPIAVTILTTVDPDLPCINFKTIDDPTRSKGYCGASPTTQQQLVPTQWYRFQGRGGSQLPTQCISENKCGAAAPGWLNGGHPARGDGLVTKEVCFHYQGDCCYHSVQVNVHHCFGYYVYKFKENVDLPARVCTEKEPRGTGPSSLITNPLLFMTRPIYNNMALDGFLLANLEAAQSTSCNVLCLLKPLCKSFNYNKTTKECELNTEKATKSIVLTSKLGFSYYHPTGTTVKTTSNN